MDSGAKYWAFISYSQRDDAFCQWLHKSLESYRLPRHLVGTPGRDGPVPERLYPVFRDRDELPGAADLGEKLHQALQQSRCLVVICSPHSAKSQWVNEEVRSFKALGREDRVFPVIIDGEPYAGDERECFPAAIRLRVASDGSLSDQPAEPLAADARANKDGRSAALLKLIAGILNVDYAALVQRDHERRIRRLKMLGAVATGLTLLFAGLAGYAYQQKQQAELREREARSRQLANQARLQLQSEPDLAMLLALAALDSADTVDARGALLGTLQSGAGMVQVQRCPNHVVAAALSPDGRQVACGTQQGELHLLDHGKPARLFKRLGGRAQQVVYAPDGSQLAVSAPMPGPQCQSENPTGCEWTDQVLIFERASGTPTTYINALGEALSGALVFSPNSRWLFVAKRDGRLAVVDRASQETLLEPTPGGSGFTALAISADGQQIMAGSQNGELVPYQWDGENLLRQPACRLSASAVTDLRWHADGWWVRRADASLSQITPCSARMWLPARSGPRATGIQAEHRVAVAADGRFAYATPNDALILQDDAQAGAPLAGHRKHILGLWFDAAELVSVDYGGKVIRWNPAATAPRRELAAAPADVRRMVFSGNGEHVAGVLRDGRIALWHTESGRLLRVSAEGHAAVGNRADDFRGTAISYLDRDRFLVSGGVRGDLILWDAATLTPLRRVDGHSCDDNKPCFVNALAWNAQRQLLASAGLDGTALLWRLPQLERIATLRHPKAVNGLAWNDSGQALATASTDRQLRLWAWDGKTAQEQRYPGVHAHVADAALRSVRYTEGDSRLISAGLDGTIVQWDTARRQPTALAFEGAPGQLLLAVPDTRGAWLATGHNGDAAMLWDYPSGRALQALPNPALRNSHHVEFSPDGRWLAVAGIAQGSGIAPLTLWQLDVPAWRNAACHKANRELTAEERRALGVIGQGNLCQTPSAREPAR